MAEMKKCPACSEEILAEARKCKHCGEWLDGSAAPATRAGFGAAKVCVVIGSLAAIAGALLLFCPTSAVQTYFGRFQPLEIGLLLLAGGFLLAALGRIAGSN